MKPENLRENGHFNSERLFCHQIFTDLSSRDSKKNTHSLVALKNG